MRIGLTASIPLPAENREYVAALTRFGADVRLLVNDVASLAHQCDDLDGIVFSGGIDVDPASYGAPPSPLVDETDVARDRFEIALAQHARSTALPVFAICRGLQIVNVAFGGTLIADIPAQRIPAALDHAPRRADGRTERGPLAAHTVAVEPASRLFALAGEGFVTGSRHHQALATIAPDLLVTGRTRDGIVEAAEARFISPFWLGVQWHPESTLETDGGTSERLFRAFATACARSAR